MWSLGLSFFICKMKWCQWKYPPIRLLWALNEMAEVFSTWCGKCKPSLSLMTLYRTLCWPCYMVGFSNCLRITNSLASAGHVTVAWVKIGGEQMERKPLTGLSGCGLSCEGHLGALSEMTYFSSRSHSLPRWFFYSHSTLDLILIRGSSLLGSIL
jgi:hypothetical protein